MEQKSAASEQDPKASRNGSGASGDTRQAATPLPQTYRRRPEQAFLPAALEIQETPPSPIGRAILWSVLLFFVLAVVWAAVGKVDIVAVARGRIIPRGHIKIIQPLETGRVREILVAEGQRTGAGEVLIRLDPSSVRADLDRLRGEAGELKLEIQRLRQLQAMTLVQQRDAFPPDTPEKVDTAQQAPLQSRILHSQWNEHQARIQSLEAELAKRRAERETLGQQTAKLEATLPLVTRRAQDLKTLVEKKAVAQHLYLEVEQERIERDHDLKTQRSRANELQAAIRELESRLRQTRAEFRRGVLLELADSQQRLAALEQELIKARTRLEAQTLTAPVAGIVQQLAVHTVGGIVTPAQQLMVIVPESARIEVEALLENKDIGFIQEGQSAEVKIDTFPFTKYGTVDGKVINVSNDAIPDEQRGLVYKAKVLLDKSAIRVGRRLVNLTPGMEVTVEIKTGKRRLIEYFLAPLLRYRDESVRER